MIVASLVVLYLALSLWPDKRRLTGLIALVLFMVISGFNQRISIDRLWSQFADSNNLLAAEYLSVKTAVEGTGFGRILPSADKLIHWDTDLYQRSTSMVKADGTVDDDIAHSTFEESIYFLKLSLWSSFALGAALLLYFALGFASRTLSVLREHKSAYLYIAPAMIGMLVLVFFPFAYGVALSFTDTTLFNESLGFHERWIGFENYLNILTDFNLYESTADGLVWNYQNFYWTLFITICWTVSNVTIGVTLGFILAMTLNIEGLKGKTIYRVLLILPWAVPNYISALIWRGMFHPQFGVINQIIQLFGGEPVAWFDGVFSSFITGIATNGWLSFPFMMVIILGALQSIPKDMYEAAAVEGANRWQRLRYITLPALKPTLIPAIVISVVWTFNMFNIIFLVSGGEPAGANEILITKAYKIAFENYQYAYAAAYSMVIFMILLAYGVFQTRITKATESY
jgi:arabinogalactan oligomer/maltooligosaccharide transport system permease protein